MKMTYSPKTLWPLLVMLTLTIAWTGYVRYKRTTEAIRRQPIAKSEDVIGYLEHQPNPVSEVAARKGEDALETLVAIAADPMALNDYREQAMREIASRAPERGELIAQLLKPYEDWPIRQAAVRSLQNMQCEAACKTLVRDYLARRKAGERSPWERRFGQDPDAKRLFDRDNADLEEKLQLILNH